MTAPTMKLVADYRDAYPDLAVEILEFFTDTNAHQHQTPAGHAGMRPRTVQEFLDHMHKKQVPPTSKPYAQPEPINTICRRLVDLGWLSPAGQAAGTNIAGLNNAYIGILQPGYDRYAINLHVSNAIYGWPCIYDTYYSSVVPMLNEGTDGTLSIGTAFVVGPRTIVTAAHCILHARTVALREVEPDLLQRASVYVSSNTAIDLAVIQICEPILASHFPISLGNGNVLDDVMVLGYPDVPGFHPTLAAEKAMISSRFTAIRGAVASAPEEIFARASLFLITARVRGGFSGGPVLNSLGTCVGVVSREPASQSSGDQGGGHHLYDNLGYGTAIPTVLLKQILEEVGSPNLTYARRLEASEMTWTEFV